MGYRGEMPQLVRSVDFHLNNMTSNKKAKDFQFVSPILPVNNELSFMLEVASR